MEFIRADHIFGHLENGAVRSGRQQFRRNWSVDDVGEHILGATEVFGSSEGYKRPDKGLGHRSIYAVHCHMVSIVGTPAEGEF